MARAAAGPVSRLVPDPLERATVRPEDAAYARLSERIHAAESMRTATASSYGFGFMARLAIAFIVVIGALIAALDFFPRVLQPAKVGAAACATHAGAAAPPEPTRELSSSTSSGAKRRVAGRDARDGAGAIVHVELLEELLDVVRDGVAGDAEVVGDLLVAGAAREQ